MRKVTRFIIATAMIASFIGSEIYVPRQAAALEQQQEIQNVIVMIPDGMSPSGVTLARWFRSYDSATGSIDPTVRLTLDEIVSGMVRNYWVDSDGTVGGMIDSAPAGSAFATGVHTIDAHISVTPDHMPVATVLEAANSLGKSTGLVVTSNIQHATPAAFSAHAPSRQSTDVIGEQQAYNHLDVVLGGGYQFLQSQNRQDNEDILESLERRGYQIVNTRDEMLRVTEGPLWGMFAPNAMAYDWDKAGTEQPSLAEMTQTAINLLSQNEEGFFLMVEGSKIDWAGHQNNPVGIVSDILAFDDAVEVALNFARQDQNTMLLVMTDHGTGGISIGNRQTDNTYQTDPVNLHVSLLAGVTLTPEGIYDLAADTGEDIIELVRTHIGITDLTSAEISDLRSAISRWNFQEILGPIISERIGVGWTTGGHTGEDVPLYSYLPGNGRLTGTFDNIEIANIVADAWGVNLSQLTSEIFVNANEAFDGYIIELYDETSSNARMVVEKNGHLLEILENKNYVYLNDDVVEFGSVVVFSGGNFFLPNQVIELLETPTPPIITEPTEPVTTPPTEPTTAQPTEPAATDPAEDDNSGGSNLPITGAQASGAAILVAGALIIAALKIKNKQQ